MAGGTSLFIFKNYVGVKETVFKMLNLTVFNIGFWREEQVGGIQIFFRALFF